MLSEAKWRYFCCCSSEPSPSTNVRFVLLCTVQLQITMDIVPSVAGALNPLLEWMIRLVGLICVPHNDDDNDDDT